MKKQDEPFYRQIISDAWSIARQHKHLWVFGFFATIIGFGGVMDPVFNGSDHIYSFLPGMMGGRGIHFIPGFATFRAVILSSPAPLVAFVICLTVMAFFAAVFAWMTYVSVGALVGSVRKIERGGDPHFSDEVKLGTQKFWPVLGVNLFAQLFVLALFMLTASALRQLLIEGGYVPGVFYLGTFIVFTIIAIGSLISAVFATCEVVAKGRSVREALHAGVRLTTDNWLASIELALALLAVSIAVGLAAIVVALVASVPFIFMIIVASAAKAPIASTIVVTTAAVLMIVLIVLVGSFITSFQTAAWTLLWGRIESKKHTQPKLIRLARKHLPFLG